MCGLSSSRRQGTELHTGHDMEAVCYGGKREARRKKDKVREPGVRCRGVKQPMSLACSALRRRHRAGCLSGVGANGIVQREGREG